MAASLGLPPLCWVVLALCAVHACLLCTVGPFALGHAIMVGRGVTTKQQLKRAHGGDSEDAVGGMGDVQALLARPQGGEEEGQEGAVVHGQPQDAPLATQGQQRGQKGWGWSTRCARFCMDPTPPSLIDPRRAVAAKAESPTTGH